VISHKIDMKFIHQFPDDEILVNLREFKGSVIVATNKAVYEFKDDKLIEIKLEKE